MTETAETLWDRTKKTLSEIYEAGREKAEEYTKLGKVKWEIYNLKRQITNQFSELGGRLYHLMVETTTTDIAGDHRIKAVVSRIQSLEEELKLKEKEIKDLRAEEDRKMGTSEKDTR